MHQNHQRKKINQNNKMKKGQINLVFASIMGIIIIGLLLALAYRGINTVVSESEERKIPILVSDIHGNVQAHSYDYGSSTKAEYSFPNFIQTMILVDYNAVSNCNDLGGFSFQVDLAIKEECKNQVPIDKKKALFLIGEEFFESYDLGSIELESRGADYVEIKNGVAKVDLVSNIRMEFEGVGSKTKIILG